MSGLEKFEDTPAWRQKLITHLLRSPPPVSKVDSMEQRHSLEIVLDFPALIKAKKAELAAQKENNDSKDIDISTEFNEIYEGRETKPMTENADESFDAFERMCDKTGSDPDSTLFQYLHSDDKEQILALAKERSTRADKSSDMETESLHRLFKDLNCHDLLDNESPLKSADCTVLDDVEAPSRLWDSTIISNDSELQPSAKISPVKMVGLMRPSTILEANETDLTGQESLNSSLNTSSFLTAHTLKTAKSCDSSASGSSCYETAADNSQANSSKGAEVMNVDDLFYAAIANSKVPRMTQGEQNELLNDLHETLIDLAANDAAADTTVIEVSSSDEEEEADDEEKQNKKNINIDIKQEEISLIDDDKENKSMDFDDTLEEMDYLMQKGRELMAAKAAAYGSPKPTAASPAPPAITTPTKTLADSNVIHLHPKVAKQNTFVLTPKKQPSTPTKTSSSCSSSSSGSKLPLSANKSRYGLTMEVKQQKFFKEPTGIPVRRQLKAPKDNFAHIVSPIRTYTQKSSTAPLMSMFRQAPNINDAFNTLSHKEMEEESRLCQLRRGQAADRVGNYNNSKMGIGCIDPTARFLPKKAYISSELMQIVDERTPHPMPNVPKIQKYLNSAVEPIVMRHDGKMKMPGGGDNKKTSSSNIPRRANESLADLSLASGDISLYTLKDAQKF